MCSALANVGYGPTAEALCEVVGDQNLVVAEMNKPLTEIFPAVKFGDCARAMFNALRDFFAIS
jgi:hypothetical protein